MLKLLVLVEIFRLSLDFIYLEFISNSYKYAGFNVDFNYQNYFISHLFILLPCFLLRNRIICIFDFFITNCILFLYVPMTCLYGLAGRSIDPLLIFCTSLIIIKLFSYLRISYKDYFLKNSYIYIYITCIIFILITLCNIILNYKNLNFNIILTDVYNYRYNNVEIINNGVFGYINSWTSKIFTPVLLVYSLIKRNILLLILSLIIFLLLFSAINTKSIIFNPLLIILVWFYFKNFKNTGLIFLFSTIFLFFIYSIYLITDNIHIPSWLIRRVLFVPSELTFVYFDYFNTNSMVYWSNSILSGIIDYPYDSSVSYLIGDQVDITNANNGYLSLGFAHAGFFGIILYSLIIGVILSLVKC